MATVDQSHGDEAAPNGTDYGRRSDFLIAMYGELMEDINRHIVVIWQLVGVVTASVAALVLAEKNNVPSAYAVILILGVCTWAMEHIYDSNFWYNRNLVMITNIERIFLRKEDLALIHPYFGSHRKKSSFLSHLNIQRRYIILIVTLSMAYYFFNSILPDLKLSKSDSNIDWLKILPFLVLIYFVDKIQQLDFYYETKYGEYLEISPGLSIDHSIKYGTTHGS